METYLVNQLVGESFKVENVASTWTCDRGVHFNDESAKELAFVPYSNLTNYQLYLQPIEAKSIKYGGDVEISNDIILIGGKTISELINEGLANPAKLPPIKLNGVVKVDTTASEGGFILNGQIVGAAPIDTTDIGVAEVTEKSEANFNKSRQRHLVLQAIHDHNKEVEMKRENGDEFTAGIIDNATRDKVLDFLK